MTNDAMKLAVQELTPIQQQAVEWMNGTMFVLAGPGSGKTKVLTTRISKLLTDTPEDSFRILALTFTNKAADEMSARIFSLAPDLEQRAVIGTFHSFCMQLLQQHGAHIGINPDFTIYTLDQDRKEIIREAMRSKEISGDPATYLAIVDKLKSRLIDPDKCVARFRDEKQGITIQSVYQTYEDILKSSNALDFSSLIKEAYRLITNFTGVAKQIRRTYRYWLFDEFQDTNDGQYDLLKQLAGKDFKNIFAVADDDQIIYQWNGASYKQIQRFRTDFSPTELQLPTNFRCPPIVVDLANRLVLNNQYRTEAKKPLEAGKQNIDDPQNKQVVAWRFPTDQLEAVGIADEISKLGESVWDSTVVIARNRSLLDLIHVALKSRSVTAAISQRRDNFLSHNFQWLVGTLRLIIRPRDKLILEAMVGAFNKWFKTSIQTDEVMANADLSSRSLLEEFCDIAKSQSPNEFSVFLDGTLQCLIDRSYYNTLVAKLFSSKFFDSSGSVDVAEDKAAWDDITRNIQRSSGSTVALELFLQEMAIRSKEPPIKANTVSLMTIHAAKGKEFDYVFLAGLAEDMLPSFQSIKSGESSVEMEEERRNCFVAITRTKQRLYLTFGSSYKNYQKKPSRFLREMGLETYIQAKEQ